MTPKARLKLAIRGAVQGVGFRPFIYRLAESLGLKGWVANSSHGVFLEVEGSTAQLHEILGRIESERPPRCFIQSLETSWLDPVGYLSFEIRQTESSGSKTAFILPDIATCPDCLNEIFDPADRRYNYPFTNCTHCGPRFSIIEALPYDRPNTSMKRFTMCRLCKAEYHDPANRRFHAQPNACPVCGPQLSFLDQTGARVSGDPLPDAAAAVRSGKVVAVKGIGGFHLIVAAHDDSAVKLLRERKRREEKPLALMFPTLAMVRDVCEVSDAEERLLRSPECPIVLLRRRMGHVSVSRGASTPFQISSMVAPGNPYLGIMLPGTPLHHLLLGGLGFPVVATSGNLSDEPICIDEREAVDRLGAIADLFLAHDRPIVRHVDDSIARIINGREMILRRARGYAPLPVRIPESQAPQSATLAVGAHLKNTVALSVGQDVFISQHIGDLETEQAHRSFLRVIADFESLYAASPAQIAADAHPDYLSTRYARERCQREKIECVEIQHHLAHVCSCMAENELTPPALGVSWDGTGYGPDGTVWGGEFLRITDRGWERFAHLRTFRLPGGEQAVKEPRRSALGLLHELIGADALQKADLPFLNSFTRAELRSLHGMLARQLNSPVTSSVGRLFDAVASLLGLHQCVRFEGQAAMELEFASEQGQPDQKPYNFPVLTPPGPPNVVDWAPAANSLLQDLQRGVTRADIAKRFHLGMAEAIVSVARLAGCERVVLSGGCFQNKVLSEAAINRLREAGFRPYWQQRVPPNDGGIALGQIAALALAPNRTAD